MRYAIDEVLNAKCCCCQDTLLMDDILMTVPSCHFLCGRCACNFIKIWSENAEYNKKCPMCRSFLMDQIFARLIQYNMTSLTQSTFFLWIPSFIYIWKNLNQLIIDSLEEKKYDDAFRYSFRIEVRMMLKRVWIKIGLSFIIKKGKFILFFMQIISIY